MASTKQTLVQRVYSFPNLKRAWIGLNRTREKSHGISNETIRDFATNLNSNLKSIKKQLKAGTYPFLPLRGVTIPKEGKSSGLRLVQSVRGKTTERPSMVCLNASPWYPILPLRSQILLALFSDSTMRPNDPVA